MASRAGLVAKAPNDRFSMAAPVVVHRELENGLNVLVQPDDTAPVVSIQFWCATGSIDEGRWLGAGLSHLLEHLMFKGTPTRGNSQMAQQIHDLGGHLNAYTSFDRTVYHVDLPADRAEAALEILADAVFNSTIPAEEYDKEMEVIRREFAMGRDNPDSEIGRLIFRTAFVRHPYRHPVIGYLDLFNQVKREDVLAYYHERYAPQNLHLIVCGAVDPETILQQAEKICGSYPRRPMGTVSYPEEPAQQQQRTLREGFPTQLTRVALAWPIFGHEHPDTPALDLLATLAGGGRSSRLNQICVEKLGLAEQIEAFAYAPAGHGLWGVEARCAPEKEDELLREIRHQVELLRQTAPSIREVERARRQSLFHQLHAQKTMSGKASSLGRGWLYQRDPQFSARYHALVQMVTPEDMLAVAQRYFHPERETLVALVPRTESKAAPLLELAKEERPLPQLISSKPQTRTLYLPQTTLPLLSLRAVLPGGLLTEPENRSGLSRLAASLLIKGTRQHSAEQLAEEIEQLGGTLNSDAGNNSAVVSLELLSSEFDAGMKLFTEMLTEAAPTESELQIEKRKQLSLLQAELDYPMAAARDLIRAALYAGHPYGRKNLGTPEAIEAITLKDVSTYQTSRLLTKELVLAVTGPVPPADWQYQIDRELSSLASPARAGTQAAALPIIQGVVRREKIVPKEQAVIHIAFPTVPNVHPDHVPLSVLDEALSDLGSRLFIRIREELGLAYFVGTSQFLGLAASHFFFYVGTDPKKRQEIEAALLEEIRQVADRGITPEELTRTRAKMQSQDKLDQQNPAHLNYAAALDELFGLGFAFAETRRERVATIQLDEVNAAARRYFSLDNYAIATVSPE